MMTAELLFENFETLADAPNGIQKLREMILQLAVQGKLVPQDPMDESVFELLSRIHFEKKQLIERGELKKNHSLPSIAAEEIPFQIPTSWKWKRLVDVTHDWGQKKPNVKFVYLDVSSIDNLKGEISNSVQFMEAAEAPSRARKIVKLNSVIYSTVRPYLLNTAIISREFDCEIIASTAFAVFHPFEGINNQFLHHYLRSASFTQFVAKEMKGMAYPAISDGRLQYAIIPIPPIAEQHRIVTKVGELMALCDELERKKTEKDSLRLAFNDSSLTHLAEAKEPKEFATHWNRIKTNFDMLYDTPETVDKLRQTILL